MDAWKIETRHRDAQLKWHIIPGARANGSPTAMRLKNKSDEPKTSITQHMIQIRTAARPGAPQGGKGARGGVGGGGHARGGRALERKSSF